MQIEEENIGSLNTKEAKLCSIPSKQVESSASVRKKINNSRNKRKQTFSGIVENLRIPDTRYNRNPEENRSVAEKQIKKTTFKGKLKVPDFTSVNDKLEALKA